MKTRKRENMDLEDIDNSTSNYTLVIVDDSDLTRGDGSLWGLKVNNNIPLMGSF
jgi:hypothetical protein